MKKLRSIELKNKPFPLKNAFLSEQTKHLQQKSIFATPEKFFLNEIKTFDQRLCINVILINT